LLIGLQAGPKSSPRRGPQHGAQGQTNVRKTFNFVTGAVNANEPLGNVSQAPKSSATPSVNLGPHVQGVFGYFLIFKFIYSLLKKKLKLTKMNNISA
jgi:hypothetical protein